ncbi:hypothetical protein RHGRI_037096 [Rhododendron griersonianum]|uniref:Uncharacterized protein n=1 Tax=Rhododendron griersonianum TaxID=479676 RepID=A0AAV6HUU3_9ERIC|nr:hypothetical protein RHGRI_037096 [Rhododendron griersonianum]
MFQSFLRRYSQLINLGDEFEWHSRAAMDAWLDRIIYSSFLVCSEQNNIWLLHCSSDSSPLLPPLPENPTIASPVHIDCCCLRMTDIWHLLLGQNAEAFPLVCVLIEKKRKMEQEEAETNMQILHDFLHCLRKQKLEELSQVLELFNDLQECYLQKRHGARQSYKQEARDVIHVNAMNTEGYHAGLEDFQSALSTFTRYSRLRVIAELRHGDLFHSANIESSIEFDRDDELFATAGVSRRIKVFEFASVLNEPADADVQCPVVEMSTRSKLSCLSWNKYTKNHIASSDYVGIVTVWDATTRQSVMEYKEHEKRAWSRGA